ncbi:twin-arginine translocase TatA/TatE family subunit [Planctomicrobium sp. SH527]|uniref:twin-arginine translocase TatA/TatE family subunit n=1 Tax=Planctomicrobium sp. SH527 TaxID=3448123 RepID=UPI003F5C6D18
MFGIGPPEMLFLAFIALLLFGKKLPEVARSMGKGIVEFKKGMNGVEDEIRSAGSSNNYANSSASNTARPSVESDEQSWKAPRFDPPTTEPKKEETSAT